MHIVGEVADGMKAIQSAQALKPDLISLDISLPNLNGIEVARRIAELVPEAKIPFVTGHNDPEMVSEALSERACGRG